MPNTVRVGDIAVTTCCCHKGCRAPTGVLVKGSPNVMTNNLPTGRVGDVLICGCGHPTILVKGSPNVFTNGMLTGRVGDVVTACPTGVMVKGSPNVKTNG